MNYDRQKRLVERLLEKSRAGELDWQETPESEAFQVSFSKYSVRISFIGLGSNSFCRVEINDSYGRMIESFNDEELRRDGDPPFSSWHDIMYEIFELARRRVLGADDALESILLEIS